MTRAKIDWLFSDLCAEMGFCLPPEKQARLTEEPPDTVDAFTYAVFVAEGLNPLADRQLWSQVRERVTAYFAAGSTR